MDEKNNNLIHRYTDVMSAMHILKTKSLTLVDPNKWDDQNDCNAINEYKKISIYHKILALCFTEAYETYHHWSVFAGGVSGVRVSFSMNDIKNHFTECNSKLDFGQVEYINFQDYDAFNGPVEKLPFIKRIQYQDEKEYRVIYKTTRKNISIKKVNILLSSIQDIKFNPWVKQGIYEAMKNIVMSLPECKHINVTESRITKSDKWHSITKKHCVSLTTG